MVKPVIADENVQTYVKRFVAGQTPVVGLLIGLSTTSADYVVKLTRCIDHDSKVDLNDVSFALEGEWLGGMGAEICHMLPGGLDIIGIFVVATSYDKELPRLLRTGIYDAHEVAWKARETLLKDYNLAPSKLHPWIGVQFDIKSGECVLCRHYSLVNKEESKYSEWRYQANPNRWAFCSTYFQIDDSAIQNPSPDLELTDLIKNYTRRACRKIAVSTVLVGGKKYPDNSLIDHIESAKILKQSGHVIKAIKFNAFFPCSTAEIEIKDLNFPLAAVTVNTVGGFFACAYVPLASTVQEAILALKRDAVLNLYYRGLLTAELFEEQGLKLTDKTILYLPRRWGFREDVEKESFMYFDFVFANEEVQGAIERMQDAFDIEVDVSTIKKDLERLPTFLKDFSSKTQLVESESEESEEFLAVEEEFQDEVEAHGGKLGGKLPSNTSKSISKAKKDKKSGKVGREDSKQTVEGQKGAKATPVTGGREDSEVANGIDELEAGADQGRGISAKRKTAGEEFDPTAEGVPSSKSEELESPRSDTIKGGTSRKREKEKGKTKGGIEEENTEDEDDQAGKKVTFVGPTIVIEPSETDLSEASTLAARRKAQDEELKNPMMNFNIVLGSLLFVSLLAMFGVLSYAYNSIFDGGASLGYSLGSFLFSSDFFGEEL